MNYIERQNLINKDLDKREVLESIDRPIRPLVIEFNRIGLQTKYSCCGFNYDGEEEPKTHTRHAYIFFYEPNTDIGKMNFELLKKHMFNFGWGLSRHCIEPITKRQEWNVYSNLLPNHKELYVKNDQIPTAIHDYEIHVIRIQEMINFCRTYLTTDNETNQNEEVIIEDGNKIQAQKYPEWQIKPKKNSKYCLKDKNYKFEIYQPDIEIKEVKHE